MEEIQKPAREYEAERDTAGTKAKSFHAGGMLLQIGIVSSLAILTERKTYYFGGAIFAVCGVAYAFAAFVKQRL